MKEIDNLLHPDLGKSTNLDYSLSYESKEENNFQRILIKIAKQDIEKIYFQWKTEYKIDESQEEYKYLNNSLRKSIDQIKLIISGISLSPVDYNIRFNPRSGLFSCSKTESITSLSFENFLEQYGFSPHGYPRFRTQIDELMRRIYRYRIGSNYEILITDLYLSSHNHYFIEPILKLAIASNFTLKTYNELLNSNWEDITKQYNSIGISCLGRSEAVILFAKRLAGITGVSPNTVGGYFASLKMYQYFNCADDVLSNNRKYFFELYPCLFERICFESFWDSSLYNEFQQAIDKGQKTLVEKLLVDHYLNTKKPRDDKLLPAFYKTSAKKLQYLIPDQKTNISITRLIDYDWLNKDIFATPIHEEGKHKLLFNLTEEQVKEFVDNETAFFQVIAACGKMAEYIISGLCNSRTCDLNCGDHDENILLKNILKASTKNKKQISTIYKACSTSFSQTASGCVDAAKDCFKSVLEPVVLKRIFLLETNAEVRDDITSIFIKETVSNKLPREQLHFLIKTFFERVSLHTIFDFSERWHHQANRTKLNSLKDFNYEQWEPLFKQQQFVIPTKILKSTPAWTAVPLINANELKEEGTVLNHCVGGYTQECLFKSSHIFSIRDEFGKPQSTVEICISQVKPESSEKFVVISSSNKRDNPYYLIVKQHYGYHNKPSSAASEYVLNSWLDKIHKENLITYKDIVSLESAKVARVKNKEAKRDLKKREIDHVGYNFFNEEKYQDVVIKYKEVLPSGQMRKNLVKCISELQKLIDADIRKIQTEMYSTFSDVLQHTTPDRLFKAAETGVFSETKEFLLNEFESTRRQFYVRRRTIKFKEAYWINRCNKDGNNCLIIAVMNGHLRFVKFLLKNGASINWQNNDGETALHIAVSKGQVEMVELLFNTLVECEAATNLLTKAGITPLDLAYKLDHKPIASLFLLSRAQLLAREFLKDLQKYAKLSYSCSLKEYLCGYNAVLTSLIEATTTAIINLFMKTKSKEDAVLPPGDAIIEEIFSNDAGNVLLRKLLGNLVNNLSDDDEINYKFVDDSTLLTLAVRLNDLAAIKLLLVKRAGIEIGDEQGMTPLLISITNNNYKTTQLLISHGAKITVDTVKLTSKLNHLPLFSLLKSELAIRKAEENLAINCAANKSAAFQPENNFEKLFGESYEYDPGHFRNYVIRVMSRQVKTYTAEMVRKFTQLDLIKSWIKNIQDQAITSKVMPGRSK